MKWMSVKEDGMPLFGCRVLTYSIEYSKKPELAFRILDSQFIKLCSEVTHYAYLDAPKEAV